MLGLAATVENREVTRLGLYRKDSTGRAVAGKRPRIHPRSIERNCSAGQGEQLSRRSNQIARGRYRPPETTGRILRVPGARQNLVIFGRRRHNDMVSKTYGARFYSFMSF